MKIEKKIDGDSMSVVLHGNLDTTSSPLLSSELELSGVKVLTFDLSDLAFVSSAGLRVFLVAYETMRKNGGTMSICGAQESVRKIFTLTGFSRLISVS